MKCLFLSQSVLDRQNKLLFTIFDAEKEKNGSMMLIIILIGVRNHWFVHTDKDKNEFAIGLKEDENFRAMTKAD